MEKLIYIHKIGTNIKGTHIYEFLFSNSKLTSIWGEGWDTSPAMSEPRPPYDMYIDNVITHNLKYPLTLIQDSDYFDMQTAIDDVLALGWEDISNLDEHPDNRLSFRYGITIDEVNLKIENRELIEANL